MKISIEATPSETLELMTGVVQHINSGKLIPGGASRYTPPSHQFPAQPQPLLLQQAQPLLLPGNTISEPKPMVPIETPRPEPIRQVPPVDHFQDLVPPTVVPDVQNYGLVHLEQLQEKEYIRPEVIRYQPGLWHKLIFVLSNAWNSPQRNRTLAWMFFWSMLALFLFRIGYRSYDQGFQFNLIQDKDSVEVQPVPSTIPIDPNNAPLEVPEQPAEGNIPEEEKQPVPPAPPAAEPTPSINPNHQLPEYPLPVVTPK